jgi:uncharacterized protein YbjT (DUF2867 family)
MVRGGMNILITGATGMVGQGVLRECLLADDVVVVKSLGRSATGAAHARLRELVHADLYDVAPIESELRELDACFFCLGVSASGKSEAEYTRTTYELTMGIARTLARLNPQMTFVFVSGVGTDERGRAMWARVKGRTERELGELGFRAAYAFRPGLIVPRNGAKSRTRLYSVFYTVAWPFLVVARALAPRRIVTTETIGRAMLRLVREQPAERVVEPPMIAALGNT